MILASMEDVFLTRQLILDEKKEIVGYELTIQYLLTSDDESTYDPTDAALLICSVYAELGIRSALGKNKAFLQIDPLFLQDEIIELLPAESVVLELIINEEPDVFLLERCKHLKERNFSLAMIDYNGLDERGKPLLNIIKVAKIDITKHSKEELENIASPIKNLPIKLMACNIETKTDAEMCEKIGFKLFQGTYYSEPEIVSGKQLTASQVSLIKIINLTNQDVETHILEDKIKHEPALSVNLLCIVNSVSQGMIKRISSVRSAITLLGRKRLQRWLQLLLLTPAGQKPDVSKSPILQVAILRGRMMEILLRHLYQFNSAIIDQGFIVGIISMMPVALGIPMDEVVEHIALESEIIDALLKNEGPLGRTLQILEYYDKEMMSECDVLLKSTPHPGLTRGKLNEALIESLRWINGDDD